MRTLLFIFLVTALLASCGSSSRTESTLSAAGFRLKTPETSEQRELYNALPANQIHRGKYKGEIFYAYKDEDQGVAYIGDETSYQKYQELKIQQQVASAHQDAAMMNDMAASRWYGAYYGPYYPVRPMPPMRPPVRPMPVRPVPLRR